jgi:hypothetical protein
VFADEQGMGKTTSMLALVAAFGIAGVSGLRLRCFFRSVAANCIGLVGMLQIWQVVDCVMQQLRDRRICFQSFSWLLVPMQRCTSAVMVASPASVLRQWIQESMICIKYEGHFYSMLDPRFVSFLSGAGLRFSFVTTYSWLGRTRPAGAVAGYDCFAGREGVFSRGAVVKVCSKVFYKVRWKGLIVDESSRVCGVKSLGLFVSASVQTFVRWCLSGTPIQRDAVELISHFRVARMMPLSIDR